jgi:RNA polymerase sigma factor (TIGR02999 family)
MHTHNSKSLGDITLCLNKWSTGNRDAENQLFEAVFPNLQRLARCLMKGERRFRAIEPTELVNQIYFRLTATKEHIWQDRQHFFRVAARAMRWHLIDCARARRNAEFIELEEGGGGDCCDSSDLELLVGVGCLLDQLSDANPNWYMVVKLKYFFGLTDEETAEKMGIKLRSMQRMWANARQWLFERADLDRIRRSRRR